MLQPVINAANHSTSIRNCIRRRKRKTKTIRYWRRDNHNIQLHTNVGINLNTVKLSQTENQLLARGLSFYPTPHNINWTEVGADFHEFSRRMRLCPRVLSWLSSPKLILTHSVPKAIGPLPSTGTLHLTLFSRLSGMTSWNLNQPLLGTTWPHVNDMLANWTADEVTSNRQTRVLALLLWIEIGISTDVYDNTRHQVQVLQTLSMGSDKVINDNTKRYLIQGDLKPGQSYILPKVHKLVTLDALLSLATLNRQKVSHNWLPSQTSVALRLHDRS